MVVDTSIGHVAAKDVPVLILICASGMRGGCLVLEFGAVRFGASHDALLLVDRQSFPLSYFVLPLLQQQDRAGSTRNSFGHECCDGDVEQRRIFRAIDEAGKVAIVPVRPTRGFFLKRGLAREVMDDRAGHIEDNVISTAGQPYQCIVLSAWHDESFCALDLLVKALYAWRRVIRNDIAPKLRPKADDEVHSSCGGPWFTDRGNCRGELLAFLRVQKVKLQVRMRGGSKGEDSGLRCVHAAIISGTDRYERPRSRGHCSGHIG